MLSFVKSMLERFNIRVYRNALPKGVDMYFDLRRYSLLQNVSLVLDVGANIGQFAMETRKHLPDARIVSFEPVPSTFQTLKRRTEGYPKLEVFCIGMGAAPAEIEVRVQKDSVMNSLKPELASSTGELERLRIETLDRFCADHVVERIGLLKTDTEGYDLEVLRGAERLLAEDRVGLICCEVGFQTKDRRHTPFSAVSTFLQERGFDLMGLYSQGSFWDNSCIDAADAVFINPKAHHV